MLVRDAEGDRVVAASGVSHGESRAIRGGREHPRSRARRSRSADARCVKRVGGRETIEPPFHPAVLPIGSAERKGFIGRRTAW